MRFDHPFDAIGDSEIKVRILRFLCRKGGEWTGRGIAAELRMNPVTAHRALRQLHEATVLDLRKVGQNHLYSLRDEHYLVWKLLRPLFKAEAHVLDRLRELFMEKLSQRLKSEVVSIAIYGSVARGDERPTSDLDLFVLVESERTKQQILQSFKDLPAEIEKEFGNSLALYVNTIRESQQKYHLPLFQNIIRQHQLVWGKPLEEVLHGRAA